jgi:hypothetical protein
MTQQRSPFNESDWRKAIEQRPEIDPQEIIDQIIQQSIQPREPSPIPKYRVSSSLEESNGTFCGIQGSDPNQYDASLETSVYTEEEYHQFTDEQRLFQFESPLSERMEALERLYHAPIHANGERSELETREEQVMRWVDKCLSMFTFTSASVVMEMAVAMCTAPFLPVDIQLRCLFSLSVHPKTMSRAWEIIHSFVMNGNVQWMGFNRRFHLVTCLLQKGYVNDPDVWSALETLLINDTYETEPLYRGLLSLPSLIASSSPSEESCEEVNAFAWESFMWLVNAWIEHDSHPIEYRLLAAQFLLSPTFESYRTLNIEQSTYEWLAEIMKSDNYQESIRADAADMLLHTTEGPLYQEALDQLHELGGSTSNVYESSQSAHMDSVNDSIRETLFYLKAYQPEQPIEFHQIQSECMVWLSERKGSHTQQVAIQEAFRRIEMDRTVLKGLQCTLEWILQQVYAFIQQHEHRSVLMDRFMEELEEMSGTCTTGYASRLINVLTGFDESCKIRVSWEDQIRANVHARFNVRMRSDPEAAEIYEQWVEKDIRNRPAFLQFVLTHLSSVREELYQEFRPYMDDETWDTYFGLAIQAYQGEYC